MQRTDGIAARRHQRPVHEVPTAIPWGECGHSLAPTEIPAAFRLAGIDSRAPTAESGKGADPSGVIADHAVAPSAETGVRDEPGQRRCKNDAGYGAEPRPSRGAFFAEYWFHGLIS
jgi:hypothetical protein